MSYMQHNLAPYGGIQELSFDEINFVGGGSIDAPADEPWLLAAKKKDASGDEITNFFGSLAGILATAGCQKLGGSATPCAVAGAAVQSTVTAVLNAAPPGSTPRPTGVFPY